MALASKKTANTKRIHASKKIAAENDPTSIFELARIERFRLLAMQTKNPLYIWQAIVYLNVEKQPLPEWCLEYLNDCALGIYGLIVAVNGYDQNETIYASGRADKPKIAPKDAMEKIGNALGLKKKSYNAFKNIRQNTELIEDAVLHDFTSAPRPQGVAPFSVEQALTQIKSRHSLNETRQAKARIQKGQALLEPKKPASR